MRAFVRVRPAQPHETAGAVNVHDDGRTLTLHKGESSSTVTVDHVLPPTATQADVYQAAAASLIEDVMQGFNATIMAYGQTGAGKTFTLSSTHPDTIGIMPRAAADIFAKAAADVDHDYIIHMSYVQIYQELIQDLLQGPEGGNLQLRETPEGGVYVEGARAMEVTGLESCIALLAQGDAQRHAGETVCGNPKCVFEGNLVILVILLAL